MAANGPVGYAPEKDSAAVKWYLTKLYTQGFVNEIIEDVSHMSFVTEFEKILPLRNISLDEFEARL